MIVTISLRNMKFCGGNEMKTVFIPWAVVWSAQQMFTPGSEKKNDKIAAIKCIRTLGLGLKECKDYVEAGYPPAFTVLGVREQTRIIRENGPNEGVNEDDKYRLLTYYLDKALSIREEIKAIEE